MDEFGLVFLGMLLGFGIILLAAGLNLNCYIDNNKYQDIFQYCNADMDLDICSKTIKYNKDMEKFKASKVSIKG